MHKNQIATQFKIGNKGGRKKDPQLQLKKQCATLYQKYLSELFTDPIEQIMETLAEIRKPGFGNASHLPGMKIKVLQMFADKDQRQLNAMLPYLIGKPVETKEEIKPLEIDVKKYDDIISKSYKELKSRTNE